jgi:hypothetical protein
MLGQNRLAFPDSHIEADNRLSWILGRLEQKFGDDALYVHLTRNASKVAASYDMRWGDRFSLIDGYNRSILMQSIYNEGAATDMVETVTANIQAFLANKSHVIEIDIEAPEQKFRRFVEIIGAEGDVEAAVAEFSVLHNQASIPSAVSKNNRLMHPHELQAAYSEIKSEVETRVAEERSQRLEAQNALKKLKRDFKRFRMWAIILALPMLLLLLPIWLPFALTAYFLKRKHSKSAVVLNAYQKRQTHGADAAIDLLTAVASDLPPGTLELFRSMDAATDQEWLSWMNDWAAARGLPKINLEFGVSPRFHRITFDRMKPVPAPHLVTVIIPCFNSEDLVERAVKSILDQSWPNLEVIAVNDASTDRTGEILDRLAQEDPRLKVLHNRINVGPYVSKNRALLGATGTYVTGHDADDIAIPNRIAKQMEPILADPTCKATIGYMVRLDEAGRACNLSRPSRRSFDGIGRLAYISLMIDKKILETELGFWDSVRFGADSEMIARMKQKLGTLPQHIQSILMLCLSSEKSLTGNSQHGIGVYTGLSQTRIAYRKSYESWHKKSLAKELNLPFPLPSRPFEAPESMQVQTTDVLSNLCVSSEAVKDSS